MAVAANEIEGVMRDSARKSAELHQRLEAIFKEEYGLNAEDNAKDVGYMAWGLAAVDVSIRLARMFIGIRHNTGVHGIVCDLTYQLNSNDFWQKNAAVIMPLIHAALNAHTDGAILIAERATRGEYSTDDALISTARCLPLEIFPVIAYCVGGAHLMAAKSLSLKRKLAPYLVA